MQNITENNPTSEQPPRRPKNVSERQLAANRANAQKSTGPVTEEGKNRSRFSNMIHGLNCFMTCLPGENKEGYEEMRLWFHDYFRPADPITFGMVDDLATTRWRLARLVRMENCLIREQMVRTRAQNEKLYTQLSTDVEVALAMKALSDESTIPARMDRAEGRLQRHFSRLFDQLMKYKNNPPAGGTQPESNANENWRSEPIPTNEHPVAELPPIGAAHNEATIVMNTQNEQSEPIPEIEHSALTGAAPPPTDGNVRTKPIPTTEHPATLKPLVMVAGASTPAAHEPLATGHWPPATELTTDTWQLTTAGRCAKSHSPTPSTLYPLQAQRKITHHGLLNS